MVPTFTSQPIFLPRVGNPKGGEPRGQGSVAKKPRPAGVKILKTIGKGYTSPSNKGRIPPENGGKYRELEKLCKK